MARKLKIRIYLCPFCNFGFKEGQAKMQLGKVWVHTDCFNKAKAQSEANKRQREETRNEAK